MECDNNDPDYFPSAPIIDENDKLEDREQLDCLTMVLDVDRVRYQLGSDIEELGDTTLNYFHRILIC